MPILLPIKMCMWLRGTRCVRKLGNVGLFPSFLPSSQIRSTSLPSAPKAKCSGHCPSSQPPQSQFWLPHTTYQPLFCWVCRCCLANSYPVWSGIGVQKQGSPDMEPWTESKLQFINFCFMGMYFYSEPIWPCPDGLAKRHITQKEFKHSVAGIMLVQLHNATCNFSLHMGLI